MSTKLPWTRLFSSQWIVDVSGMSIVEKGLYMTLFLYMCEERRPIIEDAPKLARWAGCSIRVLKNTLDTLIRDEKIIRLEDGRLWNLKVEEELNNSNENLNKFSERAKKAAEVRWEKRHKEKTISSDDQDAKNFKHNASNAKAMLNDAINNNNNINIYNKKNNTIVLSKKENDIDLENIEIVDDGYEPSEDHDCEKLADAIETMVEDQPPIHEQENIPKKAKRARTDRGCRLPDDFEPDYDFAIAEGLPPERVKVEIAKFRDYWKAKTGKDATKVDWQATWRNWVRRAIDDLKKGRNYGKPNIAQTEQQRSKTYRVAQYMSDIKNSKNAFKFLFEDDERTTIPLVAGTKTLDCRSGENYLTSQ